MSPLERLNWLSHLSNMPGLKPAMLKVAVVLAYRMNSTTGQLNPSRSRLAKDTDLDPRSINRAINDLEKLGVISVVRSQGGASKFTNNYILIPLTEKSPLTRESPLTEKSPLTTEPHTPDLRVLPPLTDESPEQGKKQGKNLRKAKQKVPPCPHGQIIGLYHETLPELPGVIESRWQGSKREKDLKTRWKEDERHRDLEFWRWLFKSMRANRFWLGDNDRGWRADLGWIVKRTNFDKVLDHAVNQRQAVAR